MKDSNAAICVDQLVKRFKVVSIPKHGTLKDVIVSMNFLRGVGEKNRTVSAVNDVSFSVEKGSTLGVVGRNGSGKTTLMRLLAGIYSPTSGTIRISGSVAQLSLGVGFHPDMTGRENVIINGLVLGLSRIQVERRFREIVMFSGLEEFIDLPVRTYSSGMYTRLAFSVAVHVDPDVLLLDEVLAVGDEAFAAKCHQRMRDFQKRGKTMVLVTHDPSMVLDWCDRALWIDAGKLRMEGATSAVVRAYQEDLRSAEHAEISFT